MALRIRLEALLDALVDPFKDGLPGGILRPRLPQDGLDEGPHEAGARPFPGRHVAIHRRALVERNLNLLGIGLMHHESHRSLVFSLLLLAGGGLVWLNGDPREPITAIGPGIGLGLWLLLQALPSLQQLLNLAPLLPSEVLILLAITVISLLLAWQLAPHPPAERSP